MDRQTDASRPMQGVERCVDRRKRTAAIETQQKKRQLLSVRLRRSVEGLRLLNE